MTNPMFNPQPNYSGVTIQIANPAVNVNPYGTNTNIPQGVAVRNGNYAACPQACYYDCNPIGYNRTGTNGYIGSNTAPVNGQEGIKPEVYNSITNPNGYQPTDANNRLPKTDTGYAQAYPSSYYLNDYGNVNGDKGMDAKDSIDTNNGIPEGENNYATIDESSLNPNENSDAAADETIPYIAGENLNIPEDENQNSNGRNRQVDPEAGISPYKDYANMPKVKEPQDMTASKTIIGNLDERNAEIKEAKKNTKEQKIVALTDEYIKSLENYLNNPNDEIRLMASKEILTRLDEDKDRYDDAALNALLNKMLQDPSKLIRLAALSAFASQLASGNDYTVELLQNIQSNPNADKEDALQAADILLKMSAGIEVKNVPASEVKREQYKMKPHTQTT